MKRRLFIRSVRAREQMELFIVASVSSVLLLRYYLYLTGYPQIGNGALHISHMLWGGLLMLAAQVLLLSFLGRRLERLAAAIGGIGFGVFIDEVGKFVTRDNNYFFRPSVGIIYAIFVLLYVGLNLLTRGEHLTSTEYQLNALSQLEEAVLRQMDEHEKAAVLRLLARANPRSPITKQLQEFLDSVTTISAGQPNVLRRFGARLSAAYDQAWQERRTRVAVRAFFAIEIALFVFGLVLAVINNVDSVQDFLHGKPSYGHSLIIGQAIGTAIAAWFAAMGIYRLRSSRLEAFEWFRRATLTNLLFTEFFIFSRIQFGAIPGFVFNLVLLLLINFALNHERRSIAGNASL
jgi:hypothetical protein